MESKYTVYSIEVIWIGDDLITVLQEQEPNLETENDAIDLIMQLSNLNHQKEYTIFVFSEKNINIVIDT
jgi:hypothetical protein